MSADSKTITGYYGTTPATLLGTAFVVLKLVGKIDWSWWWVTCPFWLPLVVFVLVLVLGLLFIAIKGWLS